MTAYNKARLELTVVFLKTLLAKHPEPESLEAQNLECSVRAINDGLLA